MPRVVPSQVVNLIRQLLPQVATQAENAHSINLGMERMYEVAAVLRLVEQVPPELIVLEASKYAEVEYAVAAASTAVQHWTAVGDWPLASAPQFRNLHPIKLIHDALTLCPDEFPAPATAALGFITDVVYRDNLRLHRGGFIAPPATDADTRRPS